MTRAALVMIDDDVAPPRILGLDWPEYRLREAVASGARHIGVVAARVPRELVSAIDAVRSTAISITLVRSADEAADLFHPDEAVLVMSGSVIAGQAALADLFDKSRPSLLCLSGGDGDAAFELIDADHRWTGLAVVSGAQVRAAAVSVGDWELASVLLREAVRGGAVRVVVDRMALGDATLAAEATRAARRAVDATDRQPHGWGERWIVAPVSRAAVLALRNWLPPIARFGGSAATLAAVVAALLTFYDWDVAGFLLSLLAIATARTADRAVVVTGVAGPLPHILAVGPPLGAALAVLLAVLPIEADRAGPVLACVSIALWSLIARSRAQYTASWLADVAGSLVILTVGAAFGPTGLVVALVACVAHAFFSLTQVQNRLSEALTLPR